MAYDGGMVRDIAQRTARSETLTAVTRLVQLVGIPAGLMLLGWAANTLVELKTKVEGWPAAIALVQANLDGQIKATTGIMSQADARLDGRIDTLTTKVESDGRRVDRLELRVDKHGDRTPN